MINRTPKGVGHCPSDAALEQAHQQELREAAAERLQAKRTNQNAAAAWAGKKTSAGMLAEVRAITDPVARTRAFRKTIREMHRAAMIEQYPHAHFGK